MQLTFGRPHWPHQSDPVREYPPVGRDITCDVVVIGAGITGALVTEALTRAGLHVVVVDRREVGRGSTAVSTALLQYEIDTHLTRLATLVGQDHATRAYRLCLEALDHLETLARDVSVDVGFRRRESLYLATDPADLPGLRDEFEARRAIGIPLEFWSRDQLTGRFGIDRAGALYSLAAAEVDPYRFTHALLNLATRRGARVHAGTEVADITESGAGCAVRTLHGHRVLARKVVVAAGYEAGRFLPRPLARFHDTYALVSQPLTDGVGWYHDALIWETARPYLYLRRTPDGRLLAGGRDDPHTGRARTDAHLAAKRHELEVAVRELLPHVPFTTASVWGGAFGVTADGLGFIGPDPDRPNVLFALGYGGNGITYGMIAARILRDLCQDREHPDARVFRLDRPQPHDAT